MRGRERAATHGYRPLRPPRHFLRFGPMIGTFELSLEREPKTDERRTTNDGPLSILFLSRSVPRDEEGVASLRGSRRLHRLRGSRLRLRGGRSTTRFLLDSSTRRLRSSLPSGRLLLDFSTPRRLDFNNRPTAQHFVATIEDQRLARGGDRTVAGEAHLRRGAPRGS